MKNKLSDILGLLIVVLIVLMAIAVSYIVTVGVIWLITLCFGLKFSWVIGTGIWLALGLLSLFFGGGSK